MVTNFNLNFRTQFKSSYLKRKRVKSFGILLSPLVLAACNNSGYTGPDVLRDPIAPIKVNLERPDENAAIPENTANIEIGTLSTVDINPNDSHSYSVNDDRFTVENGKLILKSGLNYEDLQNGEKWIRITSTDSSGLSREDAFLLKVSDQNDNPTNIFTSRAILPQNVSSALLANIHTEDEDLVDSFTYSLSDDRFEIINGHLKLKAGQTINDPEGSIIDITITSADKEGLEVVKTLSFEVKNPSKLLNGTSIYAEMTQYHLGDKVSNLGDINGDGVDDFAIMTDREDAFVIFGKKGQQFSNLNIQDLDGSNGFKIIAPSSSSGLSFIGDYNGDGYNDILVSTYNNQEFIAKIFYGRSTGFDASYSYSYPESDDAFIITDTNKVWGTTSGATGIGDVNGDGRSDLIICAADGNSYILFGKAPDGNNSMDVSDLTAADYATINNPEKNAHANRYAKAGDINGDGFDDLLIKDEDGSAYLVFGSEDQWTDTLNLQNLDGNNGFKILAPEGVDIGIKSIQSAGDINGDGYDDIIYGVPFVQSENDEPQGEAYIIFGKATPYSATLTSESADITLTGMSGSEWLGYSVSSAGDINGDGLADMIISAPYANVGDLKDAGKVYIIFGKTSDWPATIDLTTLDGSNGFVINGSNYAFEFGAAVTKAGDINGDGYDDLIIGAPRGYPYYMLDFAEQQPAAGIQSSDYGAAKYGPNTSPPPPHLPPLIMKHQVLPM